MSKTDIGDVERLGVGPVCLDAFDFNLDGLPELILKNIGYEATGYTIYSRKSSGKQEREMEIYPWGY